jgi:hypothetical protein
VISDNGSDVVVHDSSAASSAVKTGHRNVLCSSIVPIESQLRLLRGVERADDAYEETSWW